MNNDQIIAYTLSAFFGIIVPLFALVIGFRVIHEIIQLSKKKK